MSELDHEGVSGESIIQHFLGVSASVDEPLELLGLPAKGFSESDVISALQQQLAKVGANADALTPEADEVRLALHAAAARLLDPSMRRQIVRSQPAPADVRTDQRDAPPAPVGLEAAILLAMAMHGGWNQKSMHQIGHLAKSYGVGPTELVEIASRLMRSPLPARSVSTRPVAPIRPTAQALPKGIAPLRAVSGGAIVADAGVAAAPFEDEVDPGAKVFKGVLVIGGVALLGVSALAIVIVVLMSHGKPPAALLPPPAPVEQAKATTPDRQLFPTAPKNGAKNTGSTTAPASTAKNRVGDWNDLLRDMSGAVAGLDVDGSAEVTTFQGVYEKMAVHWGEAPEDGIVAGVDGVVEFVYRASAKPELVTRCIDVVVDGASAIAGKGVLTSAQVGQCAWSGGVLARLSREKDLPAAVRHRVQEAIAQAFPGATGPGEASFRAGALAALAAMPHRFIGPLGSPQGDSKGVQESWKAWLASLAAVSGKQSPVFTRSVLLALDSLLSSGPEPTQDRGVFEAVSLMVTALPWRKEDESRRWLLRWFESSRLTSGDLYAVTAALAGQSGAEGVDSSMVLSAGAGDAQRAEMHDRYSTVWGLAAGQTRDALMQQWTEAARHAVDPSISVGAVSKGSTGALEDAVQLARLSQAAALLWSGDTGDVPDLLKPVAQGAVGAGGSGGANGPTLIERVDGRRAGDDWLVRYVAAGHSIPQRRELLNQVKQAPSPAAADLIWQEACRGSPAQLRADARAIVLQYKDTPAVINAALEFAPIVPITRENADLIEQVGQATLPAPHDPAWRVSVRRVLVERLTQAVAGESALAQIDRMSDDRAIAYAVQAQKPAETSPTPPAQKTAVAPPPLPPLEVEAMAARGRWQREAELLVASGREPLNLAQIETSRAARLRLANGRVQEFAAEQVNTCELMAYVVVAEQPGKRDEARAMLDDLTTERRKAKHVFEQILAGERARARLWLARLEEQKS